MKYNPGGQKAIKRGRHYPLFATLRVTLVRTLRAFGSSNFPLRANISRRDKLIDVISSPYLQLRNHLVVNFSAGFTTPILNGTHLSSAFNIDPDFYRSTWTVFKRFSEISDAPIKCFLQDRISSFSLLLLTIFYCLSRDSS